MKSPQTSSLVFVLFGKMFEKGSVDGLLKLCFSAPRAFVSQRWQSTSSSSERGLFTNATQNVRLSRGSRKHPQIILYSLLLSFLISLSVLICLVDVFLFCPYIPPKVPLTRAFFFSRLPPSKALHCAVSSSYRVSNFLISIP